MATNVSTIYDLIWVIGDDLSGDYVLINDIDLSSSDPAHKPAEYQAGTNYMTGDMCSHTHTTTERTYMSMTDNNLGNDPIDGDTGSWSVLWITSEGWNPIGPSAGTPFTGTFDGNGHVISNMYINRSSSNYQGFFGYISTLGCVISNFGLDNVSVTGNLYVGGLVGHQDASTNINYCYTTGSVSGSQSIGGLSGESFGDISNCYSRASASGGVQVGGFIGYKNGGSVTRCYSTGAVSGSGSMQGFLGLNNTGTVSRCYYDSDTSIQPDGLASGFSTSAMVFRGYESSYPSPPHKSGYPYYKWDLKNYFGTESIWVHDSMKINAGYPVLRWQPEDVNAYNATKVYFYNGKVVSARHYPNSAIRSFVGAGSIPPESPLSSNNFRFQIVTDIHGQTDVFTRVCNGILENIPGGKGDFLWSTGDITAANFSGEYYPMQKGPYEVRAVVDKKFGTDFGFYHSLGNHDGWDLTTQWYNGQNSMPWIRAEFNSIPNSVFINWEESGWHYYRCTSGYPANDSGARKWYSKDYVEGDVAGWVSTSNQAPLGWGDIYSPDPSYNEKHIINTEITPGVISVCFRKTFNITAEELASINSVQIKLLLDAGCFVYLNGTLLEAIRVYGTADTWPYNQYVSTGNVVYGEIEATDCIFELTSSQIALLVSGTNVLSVVVYNDTTSPIEFVRDGVTISDLNDLFLDISLVYNSNLDSPRRPISRRQSCHSQNSVCEETMYYFVYKGCLFVNINVLYRGDYDFAKTTDYNIRQDTYLWLCNILETNTLPVFVFSHVPITGIDGQNFPYNDTSGGVTGSFWQLLEDHHCVVAYFCGHTHVFRREQPNISNNGSELWHIMNSPAGGPPRSADMSITDDYANMGFSFLDVYVDNTNNEVTFHRWVNKGKNATGAWVSDDLWTQSFISCAIPSCSSSSSSYSSHSSSSSSSSSSSYYWSSGTIIVNPHHGAGSFILHQYSEEEIQALYDVYHPQLVDLTNTEKEDKLVDLVSSGVLTADQALALAIKEGLSFDT